MFLKKLCIYHGNCADGFGAAWVVRKKYGEENVEFYPGVYQNPPPDCKDREVIFVDFSYKRTLMEKIAYEATSLLILDHHKSAIEDLKGINQIEMCDTVFELEKSGAGIAWDWFFPDEPRPMLINHIEDRDLWKFKYPMTREIQAAVFSYEYDFKIWDSLFAMDLKILETEGAAIERKHFKDIKELMKVVTRKFLIGGYEVPIANLPYTLTSDAGHLLADGFPFAGCYWDTPDGRVFSLRSRDDGMDVSEIAKQYGGGGHVHASGFRVPFGHILAA